MDDLEIKLALARLAEATAQAIIENDPEIVLAVSTVLRQEVDEEIRHRRIVAERRNPQTVKELQEKSGAGLYTCKTALEAAEWDINKALEILRRNL